jgi:NOL1/NOP2/fmu family ribosome biogenesis protein
MFLDYLVRTILPERKNLRVLDLCGAPGGKSTLLASLLDDSSLLISNEVIRSRATILEENVVRWGYTNNWVTSNDPKDFGRIGGYFDLIVIDAPCSGSGLFRKDRAVLEDWTEANVQLCSQRQKRIIADVWPSVKEDGVLIYATCSYSPEEDEQILDWLVGEFSVETLNVDVPEGWGIIRSQSAGGLTGYRFFPDKLKGEGFFIAALRKKEQAEAAKYARYKSLNDVKAKQQSSFLLNRDDLIVIPASKESFHAIAPDHEPDWHMLQKHLYFRKTGVALGMPSAKDWIPAHDVALTVDRSLSLKALELNRDQALKFLKREDVILPLTEKGWLLMTYEGLGLGWIKSLGNRFNNYLPKHWRIRMDIE